MEVTICKIYDKSWPNVFSFNSKYKVERHEFEGNAGFSVGNAWKDDRIRDGFQISYVSLPQLQCRPCLVPQVEVCQITGGYCSILFLFSNNWSNID
jgi:hypothetical protein